MNIGSVGFDTRGESCLLRLSRLDPEAFVSTFPASRSPDGVSRVAIHADLLDEVPCLGLGESCHNRASGATNRVAIFNAYGVRRTGKKVTRAQATPYFSLLPSFAICASNASSWILSLAPAIIRNSASPIRSTRCTFASSPMGRSNIVR